jgi:hypothetical protein
MSEATILAAQALSSANSNTASLGTTTSISSIDSSDEVLAQQRRRFSKKNELYINSLAELGKHMVTPTQDSKTIMRGLLSREPSIVKVDVTISKLKKEVNEQEELYYTTSPFSKLGPLF